MNRIAVLLSVCSLLLVSQFSYAQKKSDILKIDDEKHYYYDSVFIVEGKTKQELFKAFKNWIVTNVKGQAVANYFDDQEFNTISTNPFVSLQMGASVDFKLNIELKDGKYKVMMNAFIFHNGQGLDRPFGNYSGLLATGGLKSKLLHQVEDQVTAILAALAKAANTQKNNDW